MLCKLCNGPITIYLEYDGKKFGFPVFSIANSAFINILCMSNAYMCPWICVGCIPTKDIFQGVGHVYLHH